MRRSPQIANLEIMARSLGGLKDEMIVVGGALVDVLITDLGAPVARVTTDVDVIVAVKSRVEYYLLEDRLRECGFTQDPLNTVLCRWFGHGIVLDVMPDDDGVIGFSNRWYSSAARGPLSAVLPSGASIRVVDGPHFIATKLVAFVTRGNSDLRASHDFEDIIAVVNGREGLVEEVKVAPYDLRVFLEETLGPLILNSQLLEAVEGAIMGADDSLTRARLVIDRMTAIVQSCQSKHGPSPE